MTKLGARAVYEKIVYEKIIFLCDKLSNKMQEKYM